METKNYSTRSNAKRAAEKFGQPYEITGDAESGFMVVVTCANADQTAEAREKGFSTYDVYPEVDMAGDQVAPAAEDVECYTGDQSETYPEDEMAPVEPKKSGYIRGVSTAEKPTTLVWIIADSMIEGGTLAPRKEVIAACLKAGITYGTARTQYQAWFSARGKK